jgi:hypothetical protein
MRHAKRPDHYLCDTVEQQFTHLSSLGSSGLVATSETAWVHRNTVTGKSVVVYSTPMTRNGPELPGSGRSRWTTNHLVTQHKIRNNRTCPDLWVGNPLVAGSSPARPTQLLSRRRGRCHRARVRIVQSAECALGGAKLRDLGDEGAKPAVALAGPIVHGSTDREVGAFSLNQRRADVAVAGLVHRSGLDRC